MKRLAALPTFLLLAAIPVGASQSKHIHETTDPYSGQSTLTLDVDTGHCSGSPSQGSTQVHLLISATQLGPHQVEYNLTTDLAYGGIISPGKGGEMDAMIDGLPSQLPVAGAKSKWREHNFFGHHHHNREMIPYDVSVDYLSSMADAKLFQFRINGQGNSVERCATARQLRDLHEFLNAAAAY